MTSPPSTLYPLIFDSITDGVFTVDAEFRITSLNAEAERITGVGRQQAIGRRCYEVLRGSVCQQGCPLKRTIETGETQRNMRVSMLNAEMEAVPICVSTAVMRDPDGTLVGGIEVFRDISEIETLRNQLSGRVAFSGLVGASAAMQEVFRLIEDVAPTGVSVLIEGESGTGKELCARAIHDRSPRADGPFVTVNCGALPDTLLESELFGYLRGAFTGAYRDKPGRFQQADGGTLFLDEVGDLSPAFQVKLLRALQEREVVPLGGTQSIPVDVRIVSATNRDLAALTHEGSFRQDLYYRLAVVPIRVAPLRDRRQDVMPLISHLMPQLALRTGKPTRELTSAALAALYDYDYPGNVRELANVLERALVLCHADRIGMGELPSTVRAGLSMGSEPTEPAAQLVADGGASREASTSAPRVRLKPSERRIATAAAAAPRDAEPTTPAVGALAAGGTLEIARLRAALDAHRWNRGQTARALGVSRSTLWRRMKDYGLA